MKGSLTRMSYRSDSSRFTEDHVYIYILLCPGILPLPATFTTRIILFLVRDPKLNQGGGSSSHPELYPSLDILGAFREHLDLVC